MPDFGIPFVDLEKGRKLTHEEIIRVMRFVISSEYETIQLYTQLAESIDDKATAKVFKDVADEKRAHAGEFLRALKHLTEDVAQQGEAQKAE